ncbi:MFS transporter [Effusibacillus dendaii]|uniref:MFS transporter n=1 Tax=Effusibacillus dendaii TaxID=2743772 RepID=A0A7I8D9G7_9BACL|nr:MFS transporter [Effusibacillus dendaii]BCJ85466.1 MFS transporter [Effusibacillus dendaii]
MSHRTSGEKFYFGWYIVLISCMITLLTVGTRLGIGPFFKPMADELGVSRTFLSFVISVGMLAYGAGMPVAGKLVERYGTRFVLLSGLGMITVATLWTIWTADTVSFFLAYGILLSFGLAFTSPVAMTPVISKWFTRQRGRALFYLSTGAMAGIAVMTPVFQWLIGWIGWRDTLLVLDIVFIVILIPSAIWIIRDEAPAGTDLLPGQLASSHLSQTLSANQMIPLVDWKGALRTKPFWNIAAGLFVCGFSMNVLGSHGVPMLTDHGFSEMTASFGVGLIGIVAVGSTVVLGSLSDKLPRKNLLSLIYLIRGIGFLLIAVVMTPWQLYLVSVMGGLAWAGSTALSSAILGDVYGVRWVGVLYGWTYFVHQIGAAVGSFLAGWGYETFGTHLPSFGLTALLLAAASLLSFYLPVQVRYANHLQPSAHSSVSGSR